jgi:hypothetical protein
LSWTPALVEARLEEAFLVLLLLPDPHRRYLLGARSNWPDVVRSAAEAYGWGDPGIVGKGGEAPKALLRDPKDHQLIEEQEIKPIPRDLDMGRLKNVEPRDAVDAHAAIERMDAALPWLLWLSPQRARLVWQRLEGTAWWRIAAVERRSEKTVMRWYAEAMLTIADELVTLECGAG